MLEIGNDGEKLNKPGSLFLVEKKTTLKDLVNALNAIGTSSEDLISIFQALKRNGALFAELEFIWCQLFNLNEIFLWKPTLI